MDQFTVFAMGITVFHDGQLHVERPKAGNNSSADQRGLPDGRGTTNQGALRKLLDETDLGADKIVSILNRFNNLTERKPRVRQVNCKISITSGKIPVTKHDVCKSTTTKEKPEFATDAGLQICLEEVLGA